jgi:hypothetical protein
MPSPPKSNGPQRGPFCFWERGTNKQDELIAAAALLLGGDENPKTETFFHFIVSSNSQQVSYRFSLILRTLSDVIFGT